MSQAEGGKEETFECCHVVINSQEKVSDVYTQLEKLGEGKFGKVYRLQEKGSGKVRAGKYFRTRTAKEKQAARAEVELMNLLHHPRLVQCLAAFQGPAELVMVMEYVAGGELFERIVDDDFEHTEPSSAQYLGQILEGLQFMHGQAIVHLDLKPENIVCVSPGSHWLKIIDFGLARKLAPDTPVKVLQGTPEFMAPEVVAFEPVDLSTDMWSVGVICYILLSGESPFQGDNDMETLSNITAARWDFEEETFSEISQQAKDFISQLLQKDPRRRLSSAGALLHPWLQRPQASSAKMLSKERIKQFLTRRKWQKTGKALLALNRLTLLSQSPGRKAPEAQEEEGAGIAASSPVHHTDSLLCHSQLLLLGSFLHLCFSLPWCHLTPRPELQPRGRASLWVSAQKRFQLLSTAARPRGGGRWEQCSCRRGRERSQCGCATLVLEHQRWLVRGAGNDVDGNHSRARQGQPQPQGLLSFGSLWGPVMSLCWCGSSHTAVPSKGPGSCLPGQ